jgi:hypothetical protein
MLFAAPVIAINVWWMSNTIAHIFIHRPFFRSARVNRLFSMCLSVLLGIPQTLWRDRHLAHHRDIEWRLRVTKNLCIETALILCLFTSMAIFRPRFFVLVYLPGYLAGLALCSMQGYWEHAAGRPTSHYGRVYNLLCFNDGYHAEHHANPGIHWSKLPERIDAHAASSKWPALLRWLDSPLELLERIVLRSPMLQRFILANHRKALRKITATLPQIHRAVTVGGGLFPRTAILLHELFPAAQITILDANSRNIETARGFLGQTVTYREELFVPGESSDCDLTIIPLCLQGARAEIYRHPPSKFVLVHDWIWRRRGASAVISFALLKRVNLVCR